MIKQLKKQWKLIAIVAIILSVGGYFAYSTYFKPTAVTTKYITSTASKTNLNQSVSATGSIVIGKQRNYGFRAAGSITEISVKVGDTVATGQQLAKIDDTSLQNTLAQSSTSLDQAQNNFANRNKSLPTQYDTANLQESINNAQAKVDTDNANLSNYTLVSTQTGKITKINNVVGDTVSSGATPFMVITDQYGTNMRNINFATTGKITDSYKRVGDTLLVGDIIGLLDKTQAQNTLNQDSSLLRQTQNNFANRYKSASTQYDEANLQDAINTAQVKVNTDTTNLDTSSLKADFPGLVIAVNASVGASSSASGNNDTISTASSTSSGGASGSSSVISIIDPNSMIASLTVPESDITKLKLGQSAQLTLDALDGKQFT